MHTNPWLDRSVPVYRYMAQYVLKTQEEAEGEGTNGGGRR